MRNFSTLIPYGLILLLTACPTFPSISSFTATPSSLPAGGGSVKLEWNVSNATSLSIDQGVGVVNGTSSTVNVTSTKTFILTAVNSSGTTSASVNVSAGPASQPVKASIGATLQTQGAKLVIPPGALSQDSTVKLEVGGTPSTQADNPLKPAGPLVSLDLGGASLNAPASLELPVNPSAQGQLLILETAPNGSVHVHAAGQPVGTTTLRPLGLSNTFAVLRTGSYAVWDVTAPTEGGGSGLEVPFYWQAGYPWCVPTSLAMVLNYFQPLQGVSGRPDAPSGRISNYALASTIHQAPSSGARINDVLKALNIPEDRYQSLNWDSGLVNGFGFQTYVRLVTGGIAGLSPPRPLEFASDKAWHAKVLVGANAQQIYFNNSNDRWSGTLPSESWSDFFNAACDLSDPNDPSKGCSGKVNNSIWTVLFFADPRPETERRGSLELAPGNQGEDANRTVAFLDGFYKKLSVWQWDGGYPNGYDFTDQDGFGRIPYDSSFGHAIPSSTRLLAGFKVVNTTNANLDYQVKTRLLVNNLEQTSHTDNASIAAFSSKTITPYNGVFSLNDLTHGSITSPSEALLDIVLTQNGVVQDEKQIKFRLIPPTLTPKVTIFSPSVNLPVYQGVAVQLTGSALEGNPSFTVPCDHLSWQSSVASDAQPNGCSSSVTFATKGSRTITLSATGYQGVIGTASVTINVTDPPANLSPVIDEMHIQDSLGNEITDGQRVLTFNPLSLSVKAHDPENDPITYTWSACPQGWTPLQCLLNGNLPTNPDGSSSFSTTKYGVGIYTFFVTADDGKHTFASIRSRVIDVEQPIN